MYTANNRFILCSQYYAILLRQCRHVFITQEIFRKYRENSNRVVCLLNIFKLYIWTRWFSNINDNCFIATADALRLNPGAADVEMSLPHELLAAVGFDANNKNDNQLFLILIHIIFFLSNSCLNYYRKTTAISRTRWSRSGTSRTSWYTACSFCTRTNSRTLTSNLRTSCLLTVTMRSSLYIVALRRLVYAPRAVWGINVMYGFL